MDWKKLLMSAHYLAFIDWISNNPRKMEFISVYDSFHFTIIPCHKQMIQESKWRLESDFDSEYIYCVPVDELHTFLANVLYAVMLNNAQSALNITIVTIKKIDYRYLDLHMPANVVYWGAIR